MPTLKNMNSIQNERNLLKQIENFGKAFEKFMQSTTPRKLLNEL